MCRHALPTRDSHGNSFGHDLSEHEYLDWHQQLIAVGGCVRWTDLRMAIAACPEGKARNRLLWSNWKI
jgi:hypothetical protein